MHLLPLPTEASRRIGPHFSIRRNFGSDGDPYLRVLPLHILLAAIVNSLANTRGGSRISLYFIFVAVKQGCDLPAARRTHGVDCLDNCSDAIGDRLVGDDLALYSW